MKDQEHPQTSSSLDTPPTEDEPSTGIPPIILESQMSREEGPRGEGDPLKNPGGSNEEVSLEAEGAEATPPADRDQQ